jgi:hypothetical protein
MALMLVLHLGSGVAGCDRRGGGDGDADGDDDDADEPTPEEREALESFFAAYPEAYCNWSYRCGLVGDEGLETCVSAVTESMQEIDICDAMVELYVQYRDELDACVTGDGSECSENDDDFCPIIEDIDYEHACDAGPECVVYTDCADGEDCVDGTCTVGGGAELTLEQLAVGVWGGSGTCNGTPVEVGWFLCPAGRVRGYSIVDGYDFLDCGTWSISGSEITGTISGTAVIDGSVDSYDYYMVFDGEQMQWGSCSLPLQRLPGGVDESDCTGGVCSAGGSGDVDCGTDCDCGRCWYCETDTCRYGGEGPYGCYRGCGF